MAELLNRIRNSALSYLPRPSVLALEHFLNGYVARREMEGQSSDLGFGRRALHAWLCDKFQLTGADAISEANIVWSYSTSEEDSLLRYFSLLQAFLQEHGDGALPTKLNVGKRDFCELIREIRRQPALYLGHATFLGCSSYLMGDEHAWRDLKLSGDESREVFREFCQWIEVDKNRGLPRPWFKVVEFWSGQIDCGHSPNGAFTLFFRWLDEYANKMALPELFRGDIA